MIIYNFVLNYTQLLQLLDSFNRVIVWNFPTGNTISCVLTPRQDDYSLIDVTADVSGLGRHLLSVYMGDTIVASAEFDRTRGIWFSINFYEVQEFGDNTFSNTCTSNYTLYASIQQWHIHFCNCYIYSVKLTVFQYLGFSVPPVYLTAGPGTEGYLPWFGRDRCLKAKMLQNVILFNVPLMCCDVLYR